MQCLAPGHLNINISNTAENAVFPLLHCLSESGSHRCTQQCTNRQNWHSNILCQAVIAVCAECRECKRLFPDSHSFVPSTCHRAASHPDESPEQIVPQRAAAPTSQPSLNFPRVWIRANSVICNNANVKWASLLPDLESMQITNWKQNKAP